MSQETILNDRIAELKAELLELENIEGDCNKDFKISIIKSTIEAHKWVLDNTPRTICSWSAEDVKAHFENMKKDEMSTNILPDELTEDQISNILDYIEKRFDAEYGVTWNTVEWAIEVELDVSENEK